MITICFAKMRRKNGSGVISLPSSVAEGLKGLNVRERGHMAGVRFSAGEHIYSSTLYLRTERRKH